MTSLDPPQSMPRPTHPKVPIKTQLCHSYYQRQGFQFQKLKYWSFWSMAICKQLLLQMPLYCHIFTYFYCKFKHFSVLKCGFGKKKRAGQNEGWTRILRVHWQSCYGVQSGKVTKQQHQLSNYSDYSGNGRQVSTQSSWTDNS